jgi:replicative DNA helicase
MAAPSRKRPPRPSAELLVARSDAAADGAASPDTIATGFASIDRLLGGGVRRRDLVVLGGDIGSGKSALALGIALRAAASGAPVVFQTGEMSEDRVLERALAIEGRATIDELRGGHLDDLRRAEVGAAAVRLRDRPLIVQPLAGHAFAEVTEALRTVPRPALLVVDYLQLVAPPVEAGSTEDAAALAARGLKALALEFDTAVLAVAQLPDHDPRRDDPRPTLDDFGGKGRIKQHADVVLALYREEMYRPGGGMEGATELLVAKNRNGPTGFIDLYFYQRWLRFEDMLDPER